MFVLTMTLLVFAITFFYAWLILHYNYWRYRGVSSEVPVYFLGNMKGLGTKYHWKDINARIYKRFKGRVRFAGLYTFLTRTIMILDLDLIKDIMIKDFNSFSARGLYHNVKNDPLTGNLLLLDGKPWYMLRTKLSPVFTTGKMKFMFKTMLEVGERLVAACDKIIENEDGAIEAKDLSALFTTDVIGSCAFGLECNSLQDPNAEFRRMGRSIIENPYQNPIITAFMFTDPDKARKLRLRNFRPEVAKFFIKAVKDTIEYREREGVKRNDFMDILIEMKRDRNFEAHDDDLTHGLTLNQIAAQSMMFFLAGFETSSTTISFCLYELAMNTEIQDRLRSEINEILAKYDNNLTYEAINEMTYLNKVIAETLRKYPVLPHIVRLATKDYKIPGSRVVLEKGTRVFIPVHSIHNDPEYFPEPEIFDPERFNTEAVATRHSFCYLPFGDGPRNCIGMRFGKMQAFIGVATMVRHFRLSVTERTQIPIRYSKKLFLITPHY